MKFDINFNGLEKIKVDHGLEKIKVDHGLDKMKLKVDHGIDLMSILKVIMGGLGLLFAGRLTGSVRAGRNAEETSVRHSQGEERRVRVVVFNPRLPAKTGPNRRHSY
ncbi:hypothetical protein DCAR_0416444 [Daucus carota subsp. sativus]|uniref:Uncharacterized protein n=1 Tax=Daucus carota subsp. sativus TaxID=79200 RepID=A0A165XGZ9_DAUCS|nr:hypothetical protein DCAR_0416444 [Daucus carota subsp. sativus]